MMMVGCKSPARINAKVKIIATRRCHSDLDLDSFINNGTGSLTSVK